MTKDLIKQDLLYKLVDSLSFISGNAQMASVIDHPRWSVKHVQAIINEIDNTLALLQQVAELIDIDSQDPEVYLEDNEQLYH